MISSPAPLNPRARRDLAVAWMNRGHELQAKGEPADLTSALEAYAQSVEGLRGLVREAGAQPDPSWVVSLGAALMNRGQLLFRARGLAAADEASACLQEAESLLVPLAAPDRPWARRNLAGTRLHRAGLELARAQVAAARANAAAALELVAPYEREELVDADLGLKSRRTLCDAIGRLVAQPGTDQDALAHEASDYVDDALALARHWSGRGAPYPREIALRIFRFGAHLYRLHQPHFLAEFLAEHLVPPHDADPAIQAIALENIDAALTPSAYEPYYTIGEAASERRLAAAQDLKALRQRVAALSAHS